VLQPQQLVLQAVAHHGVDGAERLVGDRVAETLRHAPELDHSETLMS
jgi:hypothetical protein